MNKSHLCHLKSKYVGFLVIPQTDGLDVFRKNGEHVLCVRNGKDLSEELGCAHRLDLSPIPKQSRLYKEIDGKIVKDDKHDERLTARAQFVGDDGQVLSCEQLAKLGWQFDEKHNVVNSPKQTEQKSA